VKNPAENAPVRPKLELPGATAIEPRVDRARSAGMIAQPLDLEYYD
jgi:hypothetical protein